MTSSPRPPHRSSAFWLLVVAFVVEFFLFDHFGSRRVTGIYPRWNDQIQYLSECYTGYEYARAHGLPAGLWHTLVNPSAQGTLHDFAAVIAFQFVGASRSAALALNLLALVGWQFALFLAVRATSRRDSVAMAAAMLPLVLAGPWQNIPGSAYDFRLDHLAMCALGITSAIAVLTGGLRRRDWSIVFGIVTGITLLTRFLTGTYFVVIFVTLLAWTLSSKDRRIRTTNLLLATAIAIALAGPIFWINREALWNYYYIGHYVGPESAIRNQNFGIGRSLAFVFGQLAERHIGSFFGWFALGAGLAFGLCRWFGPNGSAGENATAETVAPTSTSARETISLGFTFLLAPALVLTLHPQKSEVVVGALVPGTILLVVGIWLLLAGRRSSGRIAALDRLAGLAALLVALVYFGRCQTCQFEDPATLANLRQVNGVANYILTHAQRAKINPIRVSVDNITDALDAQVLRVVCYEQHHVWADFDMRLPIGIAEPEAAEVRRRIAESDFVFLGADSAPGGIYPYDRKLAALRPELRAWCDKHLKLAASFVLSGRPVVLYQRREIPFP